MNDDRGQDLPGDPEVLRADRDLARQELGHTLEELTDKFDVRHRAEDKAHETAQAAKHRADDAKQRVTVTADQARELVGSRSDSSRGGGGKTFGVPALPIGAAVIAGGAVFWLIRRRRRSC